MSKCRYPHCNQDAYKTWSLVHLCKEHYQSIVKETKRYYEGQGRQKISDDERAFFHAIKPMIPWMKKGENHEICRD